VKYGSLFSGIEAATVAWHGFGWQPQFFAEIEPFPCSVLAHHYPHVPNHGDVSKFQEWPDHAIDVLVGGSPCQSFSVAGLRKGLADPRGNLMLTYLAIVARYRPKWMVWENVPGVLSSNGGRDFGTFLGALGQLGYGFAYRVLDAQYARVGDFPHAVPQRRRRVFVVGYLGDWRRAAAVLFDAASLRGDSPPSRDAGKGVAPTISSRPTGGGGLGTDFDLDGGLIASTGDVAHCLNAGGMGRQDYETETMVAHAQPIAFSGKDYGADAGDISPTLRSMGHDGSHANGGGQLAVAFDMRGRDGGAQFEGPHDTANIRAATGGSSRGYVASWAVRRLTPTECERLQGFPDNYTQVTHRKKPAADGPRYKALGNSMAVNVMQWIGERIKLVEEQL
jgi:DNA (cytosine-5)-methyltransferase 1